MKRQLEGHRYNLGSRGIYWNTFIHSSTGLQWTHSFYVIINET